MTSSFRSRSGLLLALLLASLGIAAWGCRPAVESQANLPALPLLERDPLEDGREVDHWSAWRGSNGAGIATGGSPAIQFSASEGVRWKAPIPGEGNSSPVVWNDVVLLTTALGTSDPPTLAILALDRSDGHLRWQVEVGQAQGRTHNKNGYASATLATDGQGIFAFFGTTGLFCYDFSGHQVWRADLGNLAHMWGTAASPVLYQNLVIQLCDCKDNSFIAAFDKRTGKPVWRTPRPSNGCWTTPTLVRFERDGQARTELVVNGTGADSDDGRMVIAYDPDDGRELWRVRGTSEFVAPTAMTAAGLVFCPSGRNGPVMAIRPGGQGDVTETQVVWKLRRGGPYIPSGLAYRNRIYLMADHGELMCLNAGNGERLWSGRVRGPFTASLVAADGRIYAVSEPGVAYVFAAGDTYRLLATNDMGGRCLATPAVAGGELFVRTESDLYCIASAPSTAEKPVLPQRDAVAKAPSDWPLFRGNPQATGVADDVLPEKPELLWRFSPEEGSFETTAAIADGTVYVGSLAGNLYAVDLKTGKEKWKFFSKLGFSAPPAVQGGYVYVGDADGLFYCLDPANGKDKWRFVAEMEIDSAPNFHNGRVLFGSQDGLLYCLDAQTGELVWKYESADQIRCFPSIIGNRALVAGCDGRLHIVDLASGKAVGDVDLHGPTGCTPAVIGSTAYVGTEGGSFFAIDCEKAEVVWRREGQKRSTSIRSSAAATPELLVVGSRDKRVTALDPKTGQELWFFATRGQVDSSPVLVGDRVYVGSSDGRIYSLDRKTGQEVWHYEAGGDVVASPAVASGRLVIGTTEGDLLCFGQR